jgi:hypothetical protein
MAASKLAFAWTITRRWTAEAVVATIWAGLQWERDC